MVFANEKEVFRTHLTSTYHKYKNNTLLLILIGFLTLVLIIVPILCCVVVKSNKMSSSTTFADGPNNYVSGVYFSDWSVYQAKHYPKDLNVGKLSHVFYAFLAIDGDTGEVSLSDEWADTDMPLGDDNGALGQLATLKRSNRNLKVVMSIGGYGFAAQFQQVAGDQRKLKRFIDSSAEMLERFHFDGIDIDWEYPASNKEGQQMVEMLRLLREKLDLVHDGLVLTLAAPAGEQNITYLDIPSMDKYLSFWNVMCYDFAGSGWSDQVGYHSNLYGENGDNDLNADDVIKTYMSHVSPSKLVLGMPLYGRSFYQPLSTTVGSDFNKNSPYATGTIMYNEIPDGGYYDKQKVAASIYDKEKQLLITYDSPECVKVKADYVKEKGLRGGFWWDSQGESKDSNSSLVESFVERMGGSSNLDKSTNWV